jgi:uncharacterized protein (TIGR00369 family)
MTEHDASSSMTVGTSVEELQARLDASPFNAWLGLQITNIGTEFVSFRVPPRPEFMGTKRLGRMHGGVLTALIDAAAGYTLMARVGVSITSVDVRVDFHQGAEVETLFIEGAVIRLGRKLACVDVRILSAANALIASGRGTFYIPTDKSTSPAS